MYIIGYRRRIPKLVVQPHMVMDNQRGDLSQSETGKYFIPIKSSFNALQSFQRVFVWAFIPAYLSPLLKFSMIASLRGQKQRKLINMAKVTAVFKNGSMQDKDNYSPILVLSIFSPKGYVEAPLWLS